MSKQRSRRLAAAKALLNQHRLPMDVGTFQTGLVLAELMEEAEYLSTTGSGEMKRFHRLTSTGLAFGENVGSSFHEIKTEPRYYEDAFPSAYLAAARAIDEHAQRAFADRGGV